MQSKNKASQTVAEREYIRLVKRLPCSVCDCGGGEGAPSDAHEIKQGQWWTCIALCVSCHTGALMGWHGQKRAWLLRKMDELDALAITIARLFELSNPTPAQAKRARVAMN
jgi:hypothetical protein